jgi:phospholipase C
MLRFGAKLSPLRWLVLCALLVLAAAFTRVLTGGELTVSGVATAAAPTHFQKIIDEATSPTSAEIAAARAVAASDVGIHKIKHVVIIMQENHSFDNYFGTFPGADGIPGLAGNPGAVPCIPDPKAGHCDKPYHETYVSGSGGPHFNDSAISDIDKGKMNGFAETAEETGAGGLDTDKLGCAVELQLNCLDVMGYYNQQEIPNYWQYAKDFVLQDHMFEPVLAWSEVSHLYMVSGWSAQCTSSAPGSCKTDIQFPELPPGALTQNQLTEELTGAALGIALPVSPETNYAWSDITWLLHKYGVSWKYYMEAGTEPDCETGAMVCVPTPQLLTAPSIWNPLPNFEDVKEDNQIKNIAPTTQLFTDAKNGNLPSVSWVVPSGDDSEHPPGDIEAGQDHVTSVINAIMKSKDWDSTAIFLAWDDWGGYYDNMVPPNVDAEGYGIRVPGMVISPYAKQGYIDHQTLSFDAYLKFVEQDFLGSQALNPLTDGRPDPRPDVREDARQLGNLVSDFDFNQTPRPAAILNPNPFGKVNVPGPTKIGTTGSNPLTPFPDCSRATGTISGETVAPVVLGRARSVQHRDLTHFHRTSNAHFDDVCLATGDGIDVGYLRIGRDATPTAVLAMTNNGFYQDDGLAPGERVPNSGFPEAIRRGPYRWYAIKLPKATLFLEARSGVIQQIGLGLRALTQTRAAQVKLLAELSA